MDSKQQLQYPLLSEQPSAPAAESNAVAAAPLRVPWYLELKVVVIVLEVVTLVWPGWLKYCFWDFSLLSAESDGHSAFSMSGSSFELHTAYCESDYPGMNRLDQQCPQFCKLVETLAASGVVALVCGILAVGTDVLTVFFHSRITQERHFRLLPAFTFISMNIWMLTWIVFYCPFFGAELKLQEKPRDYPEIEIGIQLYLSILITVGEIALAGYAFIVTRKMLNARTS